MVAGGDSASSGVQNSAELYDPSSSPNINLIDDAKFYVQQHYFDFLQREQVRDSRIPVIVVSGIASEVQVDACLRLGAIEFVAKPIAFEHLQRILQSLEPQVLARDVVTARQTTDRRRTPRARVALPVRVSPTGTTGSDFPVTAAAADFCFE